MTVIELGILMTLVLLIKMFKLNMW